MKITLDFFGFTKEIDVPEYIYRAGIIRAYLPLYTSTESYFLHLMQPQDTTSGINIIEFIQKDKNTFVFRDVQRLKKILENS